MIRVSFDDLGQPWKSWSITYAQQSDIPIIQVHAKFEAGILDLALAKAEHHSIQLDWSVLFAKAIDRQFDDVTLGDRT